MRSDRVVFRFRIAQCLRNAVGLLAAVLSLPASTTSSPPRPVISAWVTSPYLTTALNVESEHTGKYP